MNALATVAERLTNEPQDALYNERLGDLQLAFMRRGTLRKLRLGCNGHLPTNAQVQAAIAAFHIPPEPACYVGRMKAQAPAAGRWYTLHYVEIAWHDLTLPPDGQEP